jgi:glycosyltransferase involved in cell wall biosynthesis
VIRLCHITPALHSGGVEQRITRVMAGLDRSEYELSWIGLSESNEALVARAGSDVKVHCAPKTKNQGVDYKLIFRLAKMMRDDRVEMVHVHNWSTSLYGIAGAHLAGVKRVIYGVGGRDQPQGASVKQKAIMRVLAPYVDRLTTVCDFLAREVANEWGVSPLRVEVIRSGIELSRFDAAGSREEARRRLEVPDDAIVIGALTALRPVKRVDDLIAAAGRAAQEDPRIHVVLVGNIHENSADTIRGWAVNAGLGDRIRIKGRVEDPENLLPGIDIYVNCSIFEGSSNAIMEAMAAGLPVVATRVGGTPELARHEDTALLVEPSNVDQLASALARLTADGDLRLRLGAKARKEAHERFGVDRMVRAYADLYRRIAEEPRRTIASRSVRATGGLIAGLALVAEQRFTG